MALTQRRFDIGKDILSIDYIVDLSNNIYIYEYTENYIIKPIRYNKESEGNLSIFDILVFIPSYESYVSIIRSGSNTSFRSIENHSRLSDGLIDCREEYIDYIRKYIRDDDLSSFVIDDINNPLSSMYDICRSKNIDLAIVSPGRRETIHKWPVSPLPMVGFYPFLIKKNDGFPNDTIETYLGEEIVHIEKIIIN